MINANWGLYQITMANGQLAILICNVLIYHQEDELHHNVGKNLHWVEIQQNPHKTEVNKLTDLRKDLLEKLTEKVEKMQKGKRKTSEHSWFTFEEPDEQKKT